MIFKRGTAFLIAAVCLSGLAGCGEKDNNSVKPAENSEIVLSDENTLGELITPDEDSEEHELGEYRIDRNGIKIYCDEGIPDGIALALEDYFMSFQKNDFEQYRNSLYPDYVERYSKFLKENYSDKTEDGSDYTLENSFSMQYDNVHQRMKDSVYANVDTDDIDSIKGDMKITRIKLENPALDEGESEEKRTENFFSYLNEIFDTDYYAEVQKDTESLKCCTFFIMAEGEDGNEHLLVGDMDIVFAEKDGKYYTFG